MEDYRLLSTTERDFLLDVCKNDVSRKIIHVFFNIWRAMFFFCIAGVIMAIVNAIKTSNWADLCSIIGVPLAYLWFWVFPKFILKHVDSKYTALQNNSVYIREATVVSTRHHRQRTSREHNHYKDVYYVSVWDVAKTHTYEVLTTEEVYNFPMGTPIVILKFSPTVSGHPVNSEVAYPVNFVNRGVTVVLPL